MIRAFKTKVFASAARKARISDTELRRVVAKAQSGQFAADLGGGVIKVRLNRNEHRSILLMKGGDLWFYEYLFAKKDRENIEDDELAAFKLLAGAYGRLTTTQLDALTKAGDVIDIRRDGNDEDDEDENDDDQTRTE